MLKILTYNITLYIQAMNGVEFLWFGIIKLWKILNVEWLPKGGHYNLHRKHITLKHITKERKRGICVLVDGATVDACKLRVVDLAVEKRFVVVLDGGGVVIGYNWSEAKE